MRLLRDQTRHDREPRVTGEPAAQREQSCSGDGEQHPEGNREAQDARRVAERDTERRADRDHGPPRAAAHNVDPRQVDEQRRHERADRDDQAARGESQGRRRCGGGRDARREGRRTGRDRGCRPDDQRDAQQRTVVAHTVRSEARASTGRVDVGTARQRADQPAGQERVEEDRQGGAGHRRHRDHADRERRIAQQLDQRPDVG